MQSTVSLPLKLIELRAVAPADDDRLNPHPPQWCSTHGPTETEAPLLLGGPTPHTGYVLGCRGLVREHLVPRVQGAGLPRRGPTCAGCADGHRSSQRHSNLQSIHFSCVPAGPGGGGRGVGARGVGAGPGPRQPIWDPSGGCVIFPLSASANLGATARRQSSMCVSLVITRGASA
jgi:hypothetical protein